MPEAGFYEFGDISAQEPKVGVKFSIYKPHERSIYFIYKPHERGVPTDQLPVKYKRRATLR